MRLIGFLGNDLCYNRFEQANSGGATGGASGGQAQTSGANAGAQNTSEGEGAQAKKTEHGNEGEAQASGTSGAQDGKQEGAGGQSEAKPMTQAQIDEIVKARLAEEKQRETKAAERKQQKDKETELAAQQQWQPLAEARGTTIATLEGENETLRRENAELKLGSIRARVAAKYRLDETLAERLRGANEVEIDADAKLLASRIGPPKAPETEGGAGKSTATDGGSGSTPPPPPAMNGQQQAKPVYGWQQPTDVRW